MANQGKHLQKGDIIMICGYRGHGKNTLSENIQGKNNYTYSCYDMTDSTDVKIIDTATDKDSIFSHNPDLIYNEIAFARCLKEEVAEILNITIEYLEENKNNCIDPALYEFKEVQPEGLQPTIRDVLIDIAAIRRAADIDYYVKMAYNKYYNPEAVNIITDFRYPNEYEYLNKLANLYTLRIHRFNINVPNSTIISERSLDQFTSDYIVLSNDYNITSEDIILVSNQVGCDKKSAFINLYKHNADIISTIMFMTKKS